jgi:hypothetical protein
MGSFKLAIVKKGKEQLWREYWIYSKTLGTAEDAPSGLGRTRVVQAATLEEAIDAVQSKHPDCTVMLAGGEHHVA